MKPFKTKKELALEPNTGHSYYGFIKPKKGMYQLAIIQPGRGYHPIISFDLPDHEVERFFSDLYEQLKSIMEEIH